MKNAQHAPNTETIILATRHADGTTTRHPRAAELIDSILTDELIARLAARLANQPEFPANPHTHCLRCEGDNPSDAPVCPACIEAGAHPSYRFGRCLICDKRVRADWDAELPNTCGTYQCVVRFNEIAQALAGQR